MVQNHITESREVLDNLPAADLQRNGGMPALLERTKTNIVDGLKAEGRDDVSAAIAKINTKSVSNLDDFARQVDDAIGTPPPAAVASDTNVASKATGLSKGVEAKAIEKKLADSFDGLSEYDTITIKDQASRADDILRRDPDKARRIAMGLEKAPEGTKDFAVYVALEQQAARNGDVATLRDLATKSTLNRKSSESAQALRLLAERDPDSPVAKIAEIATARAKAAARRGVDPEKAVAAGVKEAKAAMAKAPKAPKETWASFIDEITC